MAVVHEAKGDSYRLREKLKAGLLKSKTVLEGQRPATDHLCRQVGEIPMTTAGDS